MGTLFALWRCVNPFDARYIAGGSSSGSAVAVALGHVSFALGTDTAGSGRVPAGFCNIVGLKPTRGLIGMSGVVPACRSLDCVSIFALTAEDALAVLEVARGDDPDDPYSRGDTAALTDRALPHPRCGVRALSYRTPSATSRRGSRSIMRSRHYGRWAPRSSRSTTSLLPKSRGCSTKGRGSPSDLPRPNPSSTSRREMRSPVTREIIRVRDSDTAIDAFEAQYRLQILKSRCAKEWEQMDMLAVPTSRRRI